MHESVCIFKVTIKLPGRCSSKTYFKWASWSSCRYNTGSYAELCTEIGIKQRFRECIRWVWLKVKRCLYNISVVIAMKVSMKIEAVNIQFMMTGRNGRSVLVGQIEDVGQREVLTQTLVEGFATWNAGPIFHVIVKTKSTLWGVN